MKLISFAMTTEAFLAGRKTVTRRIGWKGVRPGDQLMAVEKSRGLKKGEKVRRLGVIQVLSVRREPLAAITSADVVREGFGATPPEVFIRMFGEATRCSSADQVTRIEFRRLPELKPRARVRAKASAR